MWTRSIDGSIKSNIELMVNCLIPAFNVAYFHRNEAIILMCTHAHL
jgi:hypothetical protein